MLDFTCTGPSCAALEDFLLGSTTDAGSGVVQYSSASQCDSFDSKYYGPILFTQPKNAADLLVSQEQNITLPNCTSLHIQSDGTTAGTKVDSVDIAGLIACQPRHRRVTPPRDRRQRHKAHPKQVRRPLRELADTSSVDWGELNPPQRQQQRQQVLQPRLGPQESLLSLEPLSPIAQSLASS
jgi:hypothetical protein